jgi:hypothetical protein
LLGELLGTPVPPTKAPPSRFKLIVRGTPSPDEHRAVGPPKIRNPERRTRLGVFCLAPPSSSTKSGEKRRLWFEVETCNLSRGIDRPTNHLDRRPLRLLGPQPMPGPESAEHIDRPSKTNALLWRFSEVARIYCDAPPGLTANSGARATTSPEPLLAGGMANDGGFCTCFADCALFG